MGQPIVHFEIIGKDAKKLRSYYGDLFGWEFDNICAAQFTLDAAPTEHDCL